MYIAQPSQCLMKRLINGKYVNCQRLIMSPEKTERVKADIAMPKQCHMRRLIKGIFVHCPP